MDMDMQYLYEDGDFWYFMEPSTFEQHQATETAVGDAKQWLKEQDVCVVTLYNGAPLSVTPPNHVELEIVETDPGLRGDTAQGGSKPALLATGATVKVPLFLDQGDVIKVDTRTGEYQGRVRTETQNLMKRDSGSITQTWMPSATKNLLKSRAQLLAAIRNFFCQRNVLEVDTPLLASTSVTDIILKVSQQR